MVQEKTSGGSSHIKKASSTTSLEDDFFSVLGGSFSEIHFRLQRYNHLLWKISS